MEKEKIRLRALTKEDAKTSWKWRNNDDVKYFYSGHPFPVNVEKEEAWLSKLIDSDIPLASFGIDEIETDKFIGMSFLKNINLIHRNAEIAIFIGDQNATGKGFAKEATLKTIDFAFNELNLNRIYLVVQDDNFNAIKLYEKCNFVKEAVLREANFKKGKYVDVIMMSILRSEYT